MNTPPTPPPDKPQGAETPRTDAENLKLEVLIVYGDEVSNEVVPTGFARQLERELVASQKEADLWYTRAASLVYRLPAGTIAGEVQDWEAEYRCELTAKTSELVAATEALEKAKAELVELHRIADCIEPHWKGAGMAITGDWLRKEIQGRLHDMDNDIEDLTAQNTSLANDLQTEREQSGKREAALREALNSCDLAFVSWQVGQIPGRPEDILALITKVRTALSKQAPTNDTQGCTP